MNVCHKTAENTFNTWQKRNYTEILSDTIIGKIAEKGFNLFVSNGLCNKHVRFYDDFRIDNFKNHNSVDMIFGRNIESLDKASKFIAEKSLSSTYKLSDSLKERLDKAQIRIVEIKSTRITDFYKNNNKIDFEKIINMDYLTYPKFIRKSDDILTSRDYIKFVSEKYKINENEIINNEKKNLVDWYVRIFVEEKMDGKYDVYIVGVLYGKHFINEDNSFNIKKMKKNGKSESAIYLSKKIKFGISPLRFRDKYIKHS